MAGLLFKAPWGNTLITITALTCGLLLVIMLMGLFTGPRSQPVWIGCMIILPLTILLGSALFTVRGYTLTANTLYIQRLLWRTPIALENLQAAVYDPQAMNNSLRTWGNGGLFGFTGHFRNQKLGRYEAFATDLKRTVVLTFPNRKIVLSPDDPDTFVHRLSHPPSDA